MNGYYAAEENEKLRRKVIGLRRKAKSYEGIIRRARKLHHQGWYQITEDILDEADFWQKGKGGK